MPTFSPKIGGSKPNDAWIFYYHNFTAGEYIGKTLLVRVFKDSYDDNSKIDVGWMLTRKFLKLFNSEERDERAWWWSWGTPPNRISEVVIMWRDSPYFEGMEPGEFVCKFLGLKRHWTEWGK